MSIDREQNAGRASLRLADNVVEVERQQSKLPRQFVNFTFYRARPEWRALDEKEKERGKEEFSKVIEEFNRTLLIHSYSLTGLRTNAEMMIWRIGRELDPFQEMTAELNRTGLG